MIRDGQKSGSGIRDKHTGSATAPLLISTFDIALCIGIVPNPYPTFHFDVDSDPHPDPDPQVLHMLENQKYFLTFIHINASLQCFMFLVSVIAAIILSFLEVYLDWTKSVV